MNIKLMDKEKEPILIYTSKAYSEIKALMTTAHAKTDEFMFIGLAEKEDCNYVVTDIYLVPQINCTGYHCETDDDRYSEFLNKNIPIEKRCKIRLHGHSHVNMQTNPSGTDNIQINDLVKEVDDFYIQLIINQRFENFVKIIDKENGLVYENIPEFLRIGTDMVCLTKNYPGERIHIVKSKRIPKCEIDTLVPINTTTILDLGLNEIDMQDENVTLFFPLLCENFSCFLTRGKEMEAELKMSKMIKNKYITQEDIGGKKWI